MKVLIIEDETLAAEKLQHELLAIRKDMQIVATLKSVESAVAWLNENHDYDVIFSDIRLLDGLCFEIFEQVKVEKPVIFTTAYDQYAIKAFEVNSVDYLLKPVQREKLAASLEKLKTRTNTDATTRPDYNEIVKLLQSGHPGYKSRFMVRLGQKIVAVPVEKVAYFFSENKLTYAVTKDNKKYPLDQPLEEVSDLLDPKIFFRINRQYIVTFESIGEMHPHFKGRIKLVLQPPAPDEIVISSERTPAFKKWIDQ